MSTRSRAASSGSFFEHKLQRAAGLKQLYSPPCPVTHGSSSRVRRWNGRRRSPVPGRGGADGWPGQHGAGPRRAARRAVRELHHPRDRARRPAGAAAIDRVLQPAGGRVVAPRDPRERLRHQRLRPRPRERPDAAAAGDAAAPGRGSARRGTRAPPDRHAQLHGPGARPDAHTALLPRSRRGWPPTRAPRRRPRRRPTCTRASACCRTWRSSTGPR